MYDLKRSVTEKLFDLNSDFIHNSLYSVAKPNLDSCINMLLSKKEKIIIPNYQLITTELCQIMHEYLILTKFRNGWVIFFGLSFWGV